MGYYRIFAVILVPATLVEQARTFLRKHGIGEAILTKPIIRIADPDDQAPRGYVGMVRVDTGGWATLKKAVAGQANCYVFGDMRKKQAAASALAFIKAKGFRLKPSA